MRKLLGRYNQSNSGILMEGIKKIEWKVLARTNERYRGEPMESIWERQ